MISIQRKSLILTCALLAAILSLFTTFQAPLNMPTQQINVQALQQPDQTAWAEANVENGYKAGEDVDADYMNPAEALGVPDGQSRSGYVSLGNDMGEDGRPDDPRNCGAYLILGWTSLRFYDGVGADIRVAEVGSSSGGVGEPTHVYVSEDDQTWYYIDRVDGDSDSVDIDSSPDVPLNAQFRFVALCDVQDGFTSGYVGTGGPDIDAVGVNHWNEFTEPELGIIPQDGNWKRNDMMLPPGEHSPIEQGDRISYSCMALNSGDQNCSNPRAAVAINCYSPGLTYDIVFKLWFLSQSGGKDLLLNMGLEDLPPDFLERYLVECHDVNRAVSHAADDPLTSFQLYEGQVGITVPNDGPVNEIQTGTADILFDGGDIFSVSYSPFEIAAGIAAYDGQLQITPADPQIAPFTLESGQWARVTQDFPPTFGDLEQTYLPFIRGN